MLSGVSSASAALDIARRSPRRCPWCWRRRICSRCCRCRRRGRRAAASPWWRGPALRWPPAAVCQLLVGDAGEQRFCQTVRRISPSPKSRAMLRRGLPSARRSDGRSSAPRRSSSRRAASARCTPIWASRSGRGRSLMQSSGMRVSGRPRRVFDLGDEFVEAPGVEQVFEPRLGAVGAVAVIDEDAHDGVGDLGGLLGLQVEAGRSRRNPCGR